VHLKRFMLCFCWMNYSVNVNWVPFGRCCLVLLKPCWSSVYLFLGTERGMLTSQIIIVTLSISSFNFINFLSCFESLLLVTHIVRLFYSLGELAILLLGGLFLLIFTYPVQLIYMICHFYHFTVIYIVRYKVGFFYRQHITLCKKNSIVIISVFWFVF
jgi:hypothetical protein